MNVRKLTLNYSGVDIGVSEILLLIYISSIILVSMIPIGNLISQILGILLVGYFIFFLVFPKKKKILISSEFKYLLIFVFICMISGYVATDISVVTKKIITILQLIILFVVGYSIIMQSNMKMEHFYYTIVLSVSFVLLIGLAMHVSDPIITRNRLTSTAADPNFLAVLSAFAVLFALGLFTTVKKTFSKSSMLLLIIFLLTGIVRTQSRQGILLVVFNVIIFLIIDNYKSVFSKNRKKNIIQITLSIVLMVGILLTIVYLYQNTEYFIRIQLLISYIKLNLNSSNASNMILTADTSVFERKQLIEYGVKIWKDHPLLGVGLDNYRVIIREYWPISRKLYSHNNYVELLSTIGTFGMLSFYFIYWSAYRKISAIRKSNLLDNNQFKITTVILVTILGLLFTDLFTVTYYVKFVWVFLFILLGFLDKTKKSIIDECPNKIPVA